MKVSLVTVTFNSDQTLRDTIQILSILLLMVCLKIIRLILSANVSRSFKGG